MNKWHKLRHEKNEMSVFVSPCNFVLIVSFYVCLHLEMGYAVKVAACKVTSSTEATTVLPDAGSGFFKDAAPAPKAAGGSCLEEALALFMWFLDFLETSDGLQPRSHGSTLRAMAT